jgi:hypothetical protein
MMRRCPAAAWTTCVGLTALLLEGTGGASLQPSTEPGCQLPEAGRHWLQEALEGWSKIRHRALGLASGPLPWLVLFDERCVWHLSPDPSTRSEMARTSAPLSIDGEPVPAFSASHTGQIVLPNGRHMAARATASTSVYGAGSATFSVVSMPGLWERDPRHVGRARIGEFFQGLLIHELTHSTQLVGVIDRVAALRKANAMPATVDDDIVQRRFGLVPGFRTAIEAERNVFYRAVATSDQAKRREWAEQGLSMVRKRRSRFYTNESQSFRDLEDIFFAMEGSAQWAAYRWARLQAGPEVSDEAVIRFVRDDRKFWSQDEGLALYLLIDAFVPGWQKRTFGNTIASPFVLLEEAIRKWAQASSRPKSQAPSPDARFRPDP